MISRPSDHLLKSEDWQKLLSLIMGKIKESSDHTKNLKNLDTLLQQLAFPGFKWRECDFLRILEAFDASHTENSQVHKIAASIWGRLLAIHAGRIESKETYLRIRGIFRAHLEIFKKAGTAVPLYTVSLYELSQRDVRFAEDLLEELGREDVDPTQWIDIVDVEWKSHEFPLLIESLAVKSSKFRPEIALQSILMLQMRLADCLVEFRKNAILVEGMKILRSVHKLFLEIEKRLDPKELKMDANGLNFFRYRDRFHGRPDKIPEGFLPMEKELVGEPAVEVCTHQIPDVLLTAYTFHFYLINLFLPIQDEVKKKFFGLFADLSKQTFQALLDSKSLKYSITPLLTIARELWPFVAAESNESNFLFTGFISAMKDGPFKTLDINQKWLFFANLVVGMTTAELTTSSPTHIRKAFQFLQEVFCESSFKINLEEHGAVQIAYGLLLSDILKMETARSEFLSTDEVKIAQGFFRSDISEMENERPEFLSMALTCAETILPFYKQYLVEMPALISASDILDQSTIQFFTMIKDRQLFELLIKKAKEIKVREIGDAKMKKKARDQQHAMRKRAAMLQRALQFTKK